MKASDFYGLVATIFMAPHLQVWAAVWCFAAFGALSLACRYWGES